MKPLLLVWVFLFPLAFAKAAGINFPTNKVEAETVDQETKLAMEYARQYYSGQGIPQAIQAGRTYESCMNDCYAIKRSAELECSARCHEPYMSNATSERIGSPNCYGQGGRIKICAGNRYPQAPADSAPRPTQSIGFSDNGP